MKLRPIPTYRDHPATSPHNVVGIEPDGTPVEFEILGSADPVLLLFLSAACEGCADLWEGTEQLEAELPPGLQLVIITRDPKDGDGAADSAAIASLAPAAAPTIMSSQAYADYRVSGPPFLVVVAGDEVKTEGVAWGIAETARAARVALAR